ncbi:MAG: leucine-rich repeat domain-containing protein [Spirochaetes bacterium]|nr:leucine-rich repeat domain-containing protein [Spirochaetota bacterium]
MKTKIISLLLLFVISAMFCFGQDVSTLDELRSYLSKQPRNEVDTPIKVTMSSADESMLYKINETITKSGRYVNLTLTGNLIKTMFFGSCKMLVGITIPNSVTTIGKSGFMSCQNLTSVTIPNSVTTIENLAFYNCPELISVTIPNSVTTIGDSVFSGCKNLERVTIPNSVTSIGDSAFKGCASLKAITIPATVTNIGDSAFQNCSALAGFVIPKSVTEIKNSTFRNCTDLASITIPDSVTRIGDWAFMNCTSLKSVTIPKSVLSIGPNAFNGCTGFTTLAIPKTVASIGNDAFSKCTNLVSITFENTYNRGLVSADFDKVYWNNGRQTGKYTRPSAKSTKWENTSPPSFPANFMGTWNKVNFNYVFTFAAKDRFKLSGAGNQNPSWVLSSLQGDSSFIIVPESNPSFNPKINLKIVNGALEVVAEEVNGVDYIMNWNGTWKKQ